MATLADQPTAEQAEVADVARRVLADFDTPTAHVPLAIACQILGRPWIADALTARPELADLRRTIDALRIRHRAVPIRPDHQHLVCVSCRREWPCPDGELIWDLP